ncbi:MAG TPA: DMT family protein [Polyangiaceae bacterium]|nr:DMT family protein [Polyangiaceae bacterium]
MLTILLLIASNLFMTVAWYGHLKYKESPLWLAILASWGIAFFEYCLQVPANRWGYGQFSAFQLKVIQEVITLLVFVGFAFWFLGERVRWNHWAAFALIAAAVYLAFLPNPVTS